MDKAKLTFAALMGAAAMGLVTIAVDGEQKQVEVVAEAQPPETAAILAKVPKDCADELAYLPDYDKGLTCTEGTTRFGDDKFPTPVLICNGAVLPARLEACWRAASSAAEPKVVAEAEAKP